MQERILQALETIRGRLETLSLEDKDAIVEIGAAIEGVHSELPDELSGLQDVVGTCLEALQMLYEGNAPNASRLIAALAVTASAARDIVTSDTGRDALIAAAGQALWIAMGRDAADCPYSCAECAQATGILSSSVTLDDVASLLVQLDPSDSDSVTQLKDTMREVADSGLPADVKALVLRGMASVQSLADGEAADRVSVMEEVGGFVQQALDALEDLDLAGDVQAEASDADEDTDSACEIIHVAQPTEDTSDDDAADDSAATEVEVAYLPGDTDPALMAEFITECKEFIEAAEAALLALEADPKDASSLDTVFRAFHTIKGTSAFLGLNRMSDLAHRAESLLSRMRDGEITCTGIYADLALRSTDMLTELLQGVQEALNGEPMTCPDKLMDLVRALENPDAGAEPAIRQAEAEPSDRQTTAPASKARPAGGEATRQDARSSDGESSVRVRTDRLDKIIDMVGELVIAHSMVGQDETVALGRDQELTKKVIHLGKIVRELQYLAMSMRMVPLKATFQKMARLARDVARKSGKTVQFVTDGEDTEIDRNMVDVMSVPLVHMVRNAVDHGIETPEDRVEKGKPKAGTVTLSAYHSGGNVVVMMRDDGKGLDRSKIVDKAISRGLIESDKGLSDGDVYNLIFEPGFSTADKITDVSGRGVGLDAVKKGVEALRGRVEINSEPGRGCAFSLQLPLTMAITDGMLVRVGDERFIIPTISIRVSFRPEEVNLYTIVGKGEMVTLRGEPIPIVRLHRLFGIDGAVDDPTRALLVVLEDGDHPCALLVDELLGQHHVVAKSLGEGVGQIGGISGGAILGDGRVGLILDPGKIAALARQSGGEFDMGEMYRLVA